MEFLNNVFYFSEVHREILPKPLEPARTVDGPSWDILRKSIVYKIKCNGQYFGLNPSHIQ